MIKSFGNKGTEHVWNGEPSRAARAVCPGELWSVAARKLDLIHAAHTEKDLRTPPGNRFEHLKGKLKGLCSIRINGQLRVVFLWAEGDAFDVEITDYH